MTVIKEYNTDTDVWETIVVGEQGPAGPTGATGATGAAGVAGADGADGVGVPVGGTTGQVLAKNSATDFDTEWVTGGGGGITTEDAVDAVAAALTEGTGIDITYNDAANTITVAATGGAGVSDGDKGDIVVSASGATWMLDSGVVTTAAKTVLDDATVADMRTTLGAAPTTAATDTAAGLVELATAAEVLTGTDTARAVTPAGSAGVSKWQWDAIPVSGSWIIQGGATGTANYSANTLYFCAFRLPACTLSAIAMEVSTASAGGATGRMGLYTCNSAKYEPDALIVESSTFVVDTLGVKTYTLGSNYNHPGGIIWACFVATASGTMRAQSGSEPAFLDSGASPTLTNRMIQQGSVSGSFPNPISSLTRSSSLTPRMAVKVA